MRKAFAILFLLGLGACQYNDAAIQDGMHASFSQSQGEFVTTGDTSFQVWVKKILDSRCPIGSCCIWGGEASVTFEIASTEFVLNIFSLKIGESKIFTDHQRSYKLTLKDVTPFPSATDSSEEKNAVFTLEKL